MLPANKHLLPVIGIDIHMVIILGAPVPVPHPFIGLVFDFMDWIPKIGASVKVNSIPRGNSGTNGMLGAKVHIPMGGPFAMAPTIGHNTVNFFGSLNVKAEGSLFSPAGFMVMSCNDIGIPLSLSAGKNFKPVPSLYLPTSATIPIPAGKPVIVGGPYVPDLKGMLMGLLMSYGFSGLMKAGGMLAKKALTAINKGVLKKFKSTQSLGDFLCKHGFEPVNLITGSVLYEGIDFELPGPIPIKWARRWYSDSDYEGMLGHGTHLSYDLSLLVFEEDNAIGVMLPDGRTTGFPLLIAENEKFYHRLEKLTLTCKGRNHYELFNHQTQLVYSFGRMHDNVFKLVTLSNVSGLSVKFYYNSKYCLQKITDTAGREILIEYDAFNRVTKVEAQHKGLHRNLIEYAYNEAGDLSAITDANGNTTSILYQNHLMVEKTDRNGQTFYWKYDGFSTGARCIHTYGIDGVLEGRIEYKKGFNIVTNSLGENRIYYYDENKLCVQETDAQGNSVFHQYTDFMEPYRDIDEEGNITGYVYDASSNMTAIQKPDGSVSNFLYDESGRLQMITDAAGRSTVYVYKNNLLKAVVGAGQSVTSYEYDNAGLIKSIRNSKGQETVLHYDSDHNLVQMTLPDEAKAGWEYDAWGRCVKTINPEMQSQRFKYDLLDRVTGIKKYDGNNIQLKYDAYEQVVHAEDARSRVNFEYTPLGNLKVREENGTQVRFNYNTEERLVSLLNEHGEVYRFGYDNRGKIIRETGFDGLTRQYIRDSAGKVIKVNRPGNKYTEYEYDLAGRLTRSEYSDGSWEVYSYNPGGQLIEAVNENTHVIIKRDAAGRVISENQDEHTVESRYDKLGRRTEVTSSLGAAVKIEHNKAGFVDSIIAANKEGVNWEAQFKYNALGMETERLLPGGITSAFQYDHSGHPVEHTIRKGPVAMRHRTYSWNVNDRLRNMMDRLTNGIVQYGHDDFGNLAWAKYEDKQYDYRMPDSVGNLYKTRERNDRKYGAGGRLLESEGTKYKYDEEGNLTDKISPGGKQWFYEWAGNGMLKKVIRPDRKEVSFEYDALGRRTAKIFNSNITRWVWDGNTPLHEWKYEVKDRPKTIIDEFGEVSKDKSEVTDNLITWIFDEGTFKPAAKIEDNKIQSIITDYLGTPVEMYDSDGKQKWSVDYDIYGKIRKQNTGKSNDCPFRYQGQYEDVETGLYYNRFRYYNPETGKYISQDPIRLWGGNKLYSYVHDTNTWVDLLALAGIPSGFESFGQFKQFGEAAQAGLAKAGYPNAAPFMQGSAVTGKSFETGVPFDVGRTSDFDMAIAHEGLFNKAESLGLTDATRSGPIKMGSAEAKALGIDDTLQKLSKMSGGRDVNAMVFKDTESVKAKAESIRLPTKCH